MDCILLKQIVTQFPFFWVFHISILAPSLVVRYDWSSVLAMKPEQTISKLVTTL